MTIASLLGNFLARFHSTLINGLDRNESGGRREDIPSKLSLQCLVVTKRSHILKGSIVPDFSNRKGVSVEINLRRTK